MFHERGDARFVEQHVDERLLLREVGMDELDDDELFEAGRTTLERELHLRHPTLTDLGDQLVPTELGRLSGVLRRHRTASLLSMPGVRVSHSHPLPAIRGVARYHAR